MQGFNLNKSLSTTKRTLGTSRRVSVVPVLAATGRKATTGAVKTQPQLLARVEELKLLSQLEKSGLLTTLEKQGLTLGAIEKAGLLSKAENLGLLSAASSTGTPTLLYTLSLIAAGAGAALIYFVPDTSAGEVLGQLVGGGVLLGAAGAAFFGANLLSSLQR